MTDGDALLPVLAADGAGIPVHWIVGGSLLFTAVLDVVLAFAVIGPRVADERQRTIVIAGLGAGALVMFALGLLFLLRIIPLGGA